MFFRSLQSDIDFTDEVTGVIFTCEGFDQASQVSFVECKPPVGLCRGNDDADKPQKTDWDNRCS